MSETTMPAIEAMTNDFEERNTYEFAFHVLPTVAEGEVAGVFDELKAHISKHAEIVGEEAPERIELVYPIAKSVDGKNRKYTSAYFGWVRFAVAPVHIDTIMEELESMHTILRHLLIKLTALEEAHPYRFHENRKSVKMVEVVHEDEILEPVPTEEEVSAVVSDVELEESLEKITHEEEAK